MSGTVHQYSIRPEIRVMLCLTHTIASLKSLTNAITSLSKSCLKCILKPQKLCKQFGSYKPLNMICGCSNFFMYFSTRKVPKAPGDRGSHPDPLKRCFWDVLIYYSESCMKAIGLLSRDSRILNIYKNPDISRQLHRIMVSCRQDQKEVWSHSKGHADK